MNGSNVTADALSALAGTILSLTFRYVPGLSDTYARLSGGVKALVMLGLLAAAAVGTAAWGCLNVTDQSFMACVGAIDWAPYVRSLFMAAAANQTTYMMTPAKEKP